MSCPTLSLQHHIENLKLYRTLRFVWQCSRGWTIAILIIICFQSVLPGAVLYLIKLIIDAVTSQVEAVTQPPSFTRVAVLIGVAGGVALLEVICRSLTTYCSEAQAQIVSDHMHHILHAKAIEIDLEYFQDARYHDTLHRAQHEAHMRPVRIVESLVLVTRSGMSLLVMAVVLLTFHWLIALVLFASAVPGALVRLRYADENFRWQLERTPWERRARYLHWMLTADKLAKEIRLFGLGPLFMRRFGDVRRELRRERLTIARRRSLSEGVAQSGAAIAMFGVFAFVAYRTLQGVTTLGDLVLVYQAFQRGQGFLREMLRGLTDLYGHNLFLTSVYDFLDLERKIVDPARPEAFPRPIEQGIFVEHVSFQYPNQTQPVLEDVSLTIRPGQMVAFVGENGSGKTTLVKLLCRLYEPTEGTIAIDDVELSRFEIAALRQEMGVIFQDYACYHHTARENIWYGNSRLDVDDERIEQAARQAGAHDFVDHLRHQYDTILGTWFEDGEELSIGQWQRIALARALVRQAQIVVLDEPTSSLDPKAEFEFFEKFRQLAEGSTSIVISHRFSTVRMADCIFVFDQGRIVERGPHDELLRKGGKYADLFEMQAQYYR